jgi:hypothetical protein
MLAVTKLRNRMRRYTMMKLRIATGLGLLILMATMIGGAVRVSQAQDDEGVTLADLAGNFAGRGGGFFTTCLSAGGVLPLIDCSSLSPVPTLVPFNDTHIWQQTRDAAGHSCGVMTEAFARVSGQKIPARVNARTHVGTTTSFDPTTGSGTEHFDRYVGGSCIGAAFDSTGATLTSTGTGSFIVSDSGNRIEFLWTGYTSVASAFTNNVGGSAQGLVFSDTFIRQGRQD